MKDLEVKDEPQQDELLLGGTAGKRWIAVESCTWRGNYVKAGDSVIAEKRPNEYFKEA